MKLFAFKITSFGLALFIASVRSPAEETSGNPRPPPLAIELAQEEQFAPAAVEFRRLALQEDQAEAQGGYYWMAAYEYWRNAQYELTDNMLDRAENAAPQLPDKAALLLRSANSMSVRSWDEAAFYLDSVLSGATNPAVQNLAARRLAAVKLEQNDPAGAQAALSAAPEQRPEAVEAVEQYARGRNKKPLVGGLLGMVPGGGYFYAHEYANGLRSIILNGLFLFGMYQTASDDEWGAFAVITFFEITWYSGSIYGGVDASHRYNRRRLDRTLSVVTGAASFEPDLDKVPTISLKYRF